MNFSLSSTLKLTGILACAAVCGCAKKDGSAEFAEGRAALESKEPGLAAKLFDESLVYAPNNVDALVLLARARLELGELPAAKAAVEKARVLAGDDVDVVLLGAQIAYHQRDFDAAETAYRSIADNGKLSAELRAEAMSGIGVIEYGANNYDLARIAFFRAIRLDRKCLVAYYHLGRLYRDGFGYPEAALDAFEKFAYLGDGADERVRKVQRTFIPELKESNARAAAARPGAAKRNSAACAAAIAKAEAALKKGGKSIKEAIGFYQQALAADPLSYPAALGLAKTLLRTDTSKNGLIRAFESYKQACSLNPNAVPTFLSAGDLAARLGYNAQAVEIYSRAVAADPSNQSALDGLIRSLRKVGGKQKIAAAYQAYRDSLAVQKKRK